MLVGQRELVDGLLIALLCQGHVLVEGVPGLAKTTAVRAFARVLDLSSGASSSRRTCCPPTCSARRCTSPRTSSFRLHRGPIFHHVILADEINRAPAKVQSALLEAMEERQVTLAGETLRLPEPFLVMATQNPVEQEGVYPLPEAQVDRFMLKLRVDYPSRDEEIEIVRSRTAPGELEQPRSAHRRRRDDGAAPGRARAARRAVAASTTRCALVAKSRTLDAVELGGSPRASIYLIEAARARAYLRAARLRAARGREARRAGRAAPPAAALLRGGGRGPDARRDRARAARASVPTP